MSKTKGPNEGDVIANKFNLMHAGKRRKLFGSLGEVKLANDSQLQAFNEDEDAEFEDQSTGFEQYVRDTQNDLTIN